MENPRLSSRLGPFACAKVCQSRPRWAKVSQVAPKVTIMGHEKLIGGPEGMFSWKWGWRGTHGTSVRIAWIGQELIFSSGWSGWWGSGGLVEKSVGGEPGEWLTKWFKRCCELFPYEKAVLFLEGAGGPELGGERGGRTGGPAAGRRLAGPSPPAFAFRISLILNPGAG